MDSISGMLSNEGGNFEFRNISNYVVENVSLDSWVKYFFTVRASWDGSPNWVLYYEKFLMVKLCIK